MEAKKDNWSYEFHYALLNASEKTKNFLTDLGFEDNSFDHQFKVERAKYRGTLDFNDPPPDELWNEICEVLNEDEEAIGTLEQESIDLQYIFINTTSNSLVKSPFEIPEMPLKQVGFNDYKKCDLHISVLKEKDNERLLSAFDKITLPFVERGTKRIYTLTCESNQGGQDLFEAIKEIIIRFNCKAKIVLEYTDRNLRIPNDFPLLPILRDKDLKFWKSKLRSQKLLA